MSNIGKFQYSIFKFHSYMINFIQKMKNHIIVLIHHQDDVFCSLTKDISGEGEMDPGPMDCGVLEYEWVNQCKNKVTTNIKFFSRRGD